MNRAENFGVFPTRSTVFDDVISSTAPQSVHNRSHEPTTSIFSDKTFRNISSELVQEAETGLSHFLTQRLLIVACVVVGLFILTWGSYAVHRKCRRNSWRQQYHKALLL